MAYSHVTLSQARAQLASRLGDAGLVFWTSSELTLYLKEALRVWNAAAQFHRDRGVFNTTPGTAFYDLAPRLDKSGSKIVNRTVTDRNLIDELVAHLVESVNGSYAWTGTEMFALSDLTNALQRRRNQFLLETGMVLSESTTALLPAGVARVALSDSVIDVRRVAWKTPESAYTHLWREDERRLLAYAGQWSDTGVPEVYAPTLQPGVQVALAPNPQDRGHLNLVTVNAGADLAPASGGVAVGVPDDFAWVVKYGALAELLSADGQAKDQGRAEYCELRWKEGVLLARMAASVLDAEINGTPAHLISLADLDAGDPDWQNTSGRPEYLALAGHNLLAASKVPDAAYSITCDVVRNAPVPSADGDYLQIGREHLGVILNYAQEVALFKCGGSEFGRCNGYVELLRAATLHSDRLRAQAAEFESLQDKSQQEERRRPRVKSAD